MRNAVGDLGKLRRLVLGTPKRASTRLQEWERAAATGPV